MDIEFKLNPIEFDLQVIAESAYYAYGKTTSFKNFQGNPMPDWDKLPEKIQIAWVAAASNVVEAVINKMGKELTHVSDRTSCE